VVQRKYEKKTKRKGYRNFGTTALITRFVSSEVLLFYYCCYHSNQILYRRSVQS